MRRLRKAILITTLSLLLLSLGRGVLQLSAIDIAAAPHKYDLILWEASHLPDKWFYKLTSLLPWNWRSREERIAELQEFFSLGAEIRDLEQELTGLNARTSRDAASGQSTAKVNETEEQADRLLERIQRMRGRRSRMKAQVEETLESEVSSVVAEEGLSSQLGLIIPPVDVALSSPPRVLVVSPRDRIARMKTVLLKPNMKVEDMEALEERVFSDMDLAALVVGIGGVATYPSIVRGNSSLLGTAVTASHEWLHLYWFFRPLGWKFWDWTPEMTTLNETAATIAGEELGERVYEAITGKPKEGPPPPGDYGPGSPGMLEGPEGQVEGDFDFAVEMQETRLRVDELLEEGKVEEAERYMEARRLIFVENGFHIRKLNQAYFAFHGTYGTSPASVSPIGGQVKRLRTLSGSIGDFIRTMAGFDSYGEFLDHLSEQPGTLSGDLSGDQTLSPVNQRLRGAEPEALVAP